MIYFFAYAVGVLVGFALALLWRPDRHRGYRPTIGPGPDSRPPLGGSNVSPPRSTPIEPPEEGDPDASR